MVCPMPNIQSPLPGSWRASSCITVTPVSARTEDVLKEPRKVLFRALARETLASTIT